MNNKTIQKVEPKYYPPIHSFPIIVMLVCGIIMVLIGFYMDSINMELKGDYGEGFHLTGTSTIYFGIGILLFPIGIMIKQYREKKRFDRNVF